MEYKDIRLRDNTEGIGFDILNKKYNTLGELTGE